MSRRSNKSIEAILASSKNNDDKLEQVLDRKITLATEGFSKTKFCELILRDRTRLSKENALTVCDYIMSMKREINPRINTIRTAIQFLSELSKFAGVEKRFEDMMAKATDILLSYLDTCRKPENKDPLHKWIGSYNVRRVILFRFFKWLYYPNVANPDKRNELSSLERKPDCIMDIPMLRSYTED